MHAISKMPAQSSCMPRRGVCQNAPILWGLQRDFGVWQSYVPATSARVLSMRMGLLVTSAPNPMRFTLASSRVPPVKASTYSAVCT